MMATSPPAAASATPPSSSTENPPQHAILVVDDEPDNHEVIRVALGQHYQLQFVFDGQQALEAIAQQQPDLILMDVMMPVMDGFQCCLRLKNQPATKNIAVIFLTTKNDPQSEAFGLELGADDFIIKPFNAEVLKLRVARRLGLGQNAAGQSAADEEQEEPALMLGEYELLWQRHEARCDGSSIPLTTKEIKLLQVLARNKGRVLSRDHILEEVWPQTYVTDRTIDSHVKSLRKKIPPLTTMLKTVYGSGYRLDL